MRVLLCGLVVLFAASMVQGDEALIELKIPGVPSQPCDGGVSVDAADVNGGFILEVWLSADVPMKAVGVCLDGPPICYNAMTDFYGMASYNYGTGVPPVNAAGWDTAIASCVQIPAGCLPLTGGADNEIGTIATDLVNGAGNGRLGWIEFPGPIDPPLKYCDWIVPCDGSYVGGLNDLPMPVSMLGIHITPEPASALLLLGALPLLRRRR